MPVLTKQLLIWADRKTGVYFEFFMNSIKKAFS